MIDFIRKKIKDHNFRCNPLISRIFTSPTDFNIEEFLWDKCIFLNTHLFFMVTLNGVTILNQPIFLVSIFLMFKYISGKWLYMYHKLNVQN